MINSGSSVEVMFWDTFKRMKLVDNKIKPNPTSPFAVEGTKVWAIEDVTLPVTTTKKTPFVTFVVIDALSVYNVIMGRDWIYTMDWKALTRCQVMRCLTDDSRSTIDIKWDQVKSKWRYNITTDLKSATKA